MYIKKSNLLSMYNQKYNDFNKKKIYKIEA